MKFQILTLNEGRIWNEYLGKLPGNKQDIYYTPEYYQLYEKYGDGKAFCFVFESGGEFALYPFLKNPIDKKKYTLEKNYFDIQGAYGYNGVVCNTKDNTFRDEFYKVFIEFCDKENIIAEFTRFHPILENYKFSEKHLTVLKDRKTVWLDILPDKEIRWKESYSVNNRNMIRKALKNNVKIVIGHTETDYSEFYKLYSSTMKEIGSLPYYYFNQEYISNFKSLLGTNQTLLMANYQEKIICTMLLMVYGKYAHYHLSGRLKEYSNLAANNLILDQAIELAREKGVQFFHFGGGNTNDADDPLFKFKTNFSKTYSEFYIGKKVINHSVYEQICSIWEKENPTLKEKYKHFLLKYTQTK